MPNREIIDAYIDWTVNRKGNTQRYGYQSRQKLLSLADWVGPTVEWSELDESLLERWAWRPRKRGEVGAASTIQKDLVVATGFLAWLERRGLADAKVAVEVPRPKIRNKHPKPISDELWLEWYTAAHQDADTILFFGLAGLAGLRLAEVLRVTGAHVSSGGLISGLERKGGGEDALDVPALVKVVARGLPRLLPDKGEKFLSVFRERSARSGLLLDWRASATTHRKHVLPADQNDPQWVYKRIRRWHREAVPQPSQAWIPHALRHSFVTNLLRCGMPIHMVSRMANHSSIDTTMLYAKVSSSDVRDFLRTQEGHDGWVPNRHNQSA